IVGEQPPTTKELAMASANLTRSLPGHNETSAELTGTLTNDVIYDLPPRYYETYIDQIQALTPDALNTAAEKLLDPGAMTWIVVGDLAQIGDAVKALDWAQVRELGAPDKQSTGAKAG